MDIEHIAKLSRIAFTKEEYEKAAAEMTEIIKLMAKVTECVEEDAYSPEPAAFSDLRQDKSKICDKSVIENAEKITRSQFIVPKVV